MYVHFRFESWSKYPLQHWVPKPNPMDAILTYLRWGCRNKNGSAPICPVKLVANVGDLSSSIERVGLIVSEKFKSPVRCMFSNQVLMLRTTTTIGAAEDQCSIAGDGKELEIGFNVRYLADALRAVPSEEVTLELTNGLSPIVLTPVDEKEDFAYMVLPVRLKSN